MPVQFNYGLNPLIGGLMAFTGGVNSIKGKEADFRQQEILQNRQIGAQLTGQALGIVGGIAQQQLGYIQRRQLQNDSFAHATDMLTREQKYALDNWTRSNLMMPSWDEVVSGAEAAQLTVPEFMQSRTGMLQQQQFAARTQGLEPTYTPQQQQRMRQLEAAMMEVDSGELLDPFAPTYEGPSEASLARANIQREYQAIKGSPQWKPKDPSRTTWDEDVKTGRVKQLPTGEWVGRNLQNGGWDPITRPSSGNGSILTPEYFQSRGVGQIDPRTNKIRTPADVIMEDFTSVHPVTGQLIAIDPDMKGFTIKDPPKDDGQSAVFDTTEMMSSYGPGGMGPPTERPRVRQPGEKWVDQKTGAMLQIKQDGNVQVLDKGWTPDIEKQKWDIAAKLFSVQTPNDDGKSVTTIDATKAAEWVASEKARFMQERGVGASPPPPPASTGSPFVIGQIYSKNGKQYRYIGVDANGKKQFEEVQ